MRLFALALGLSVGVMITPIGAIAQELPDPRELLDELDDLHRSESAHSVMTMTVVRARGTRELTLESWSIGEDQALIIVRDPAREAGTATLRSPDGLWNYAPRADRLIRIPAGLLSDAWMGSHFTNDDLVRETSLDDDYEATLSWGTEGGRRVLAASLRPRPGAPVVYSQIEYLLLPDSWTPIRAEYFDEGELIRTMVFDQLQTIAGRTIPMRMVLQPADASSERTEVIYRSLELDVPVDRDLFTQRGLRRVARGG